LRTENTLAILSKALFIGEDLSNYDLIITREYFAAFGINLRLLLTFSKVKHVTIGLNQSRRLLKTNFRLVDRLINVVFRRSDLVVVHSRREAELFSRLHRIPANKFYFSLWGYDLPPTEVTRFSAWPKRYVCLVGRNNRDVETFVRAIASVDIDGIMIISSNLCVASESLPANVHQFLDLPLGETLDCIKNASVSIILLKDNDRGAGHITMVSAMFLGTPQIVSDVDVIKDYVVDGVSAVTVPVGDVESVKLSIERLLDDSALAVKLSMNARDYAQRWLTNESVVRRMVSALDKLLQGQEFSPVDPDWLDAYEAFSALRPQHYSKLRLGG
jgi:glycosyltransferase involved in cell wall biosynthesis